MQMDPVSFLVNAVAVGAAAAMKGTAARAVKDVYGAVKALIQSRYRTVDLRQIETAPHSKRARAAARRQFKQGAASAAGDAELLQLATQLVQVVREHAPETADAMGLDLNDFTAGSVDVADIAASGTAVRATKVNVTGTFRVKGVRAGVKGEPNPKA